MKREPVNSSTVSKDERARAAEILAKCAGKPIKKLEPKDFKRRPIHESRTDPKYKQRGPGI